MRKLYFLTVAFLVMTCLFACKKENNPAATITGKWNLQQQNSVQYVDGVKTIDTILFASSNNASNINFSKDGTYTSLSVFTSIDNNLGGTAASSNQQSGTYNYSGSSFSLSSGVAGFNNFIGFFATTMTAESTTPAITPISYVTKVVQLTSSKLTLHTETNFTGTYNSVSKTYKVVYDLYYTR